MARIYLALGSNVGDRQYYMRKAIRKLKKAFPGLEAAPLYSSRAVGYTKQADFLNTVVRLETTREPDQLLAVIKQAETEVGRVRRFRWGPREIDIDIIFYGSLVMSRPDLTIPHPRFAERDFVLQPLCDLDPGLVDPLSKLSVSILLEQLSPSQRSLVGKASR